MDLFGLIVELFTNADHFLVSIATDYGTLIYIAMFVIFFLETGIVVMSFLPGDSLLFVAGTVAAAGTASPWLIMLAVILGAIFGNSLGYATGKWLGNRIYDGSIHWIDAKKLEHAHSFYLSHGGKTVVLARFVPIVRAFAPLVAGAARMVCALNSSAASAPFSGRYRSLVQATFSATSLSFSRIFRKSSFSESLLPLWAPFLWATSGRRIRRCTKSANTNSETLTSPIFKSRHGSAASAPMCLLAKAFNEVFPSLSDALPVFSRYVRDCRFIVLKWCALRIDETCFHSR